MKTMLNEYAFTRENLKDRPVKTLFEIWKIVSYDYYCEATGGCFCMGCVNRWFTKNEWNIVNRYVNQLARKYCKWMFQKLGTEIRGTMEEKTFRTIYPGLFCKRVRPILQREVFLKEFNLMEFVHDESDSTSKPLLEIDKYVEMLGNVAFALVDKINIENNPNYVNFVLDYYVEQWPLEIFTPLIKSGKVL